MVDHVSRNSASRIREEVKTLPETANLSKEAKDYARARLPSPPQVLPTSIWKVGVGQRLA
jgi:hypothetical protein